MPPKQGSERLPHECRCPSSPVSGSAPNSHRISIHEEASPTNAAACRTIAIATRSNRSNRTSPHIPLFFPHRTAPPKPRPPGPTCWSPTVGPTRHRYRCMVAPTCRRDLPLCPHPRWGVWAALAGRGGGSLLKQAGTTPLKSLFSHFLSGRLRYQFQRGVIMAIFLALDIEF